MLRQVSKPMALVAIIGVIIACVCLFSVFGGGLGNLLGGGSDTANGGGGIFGSGNQNSTNADLGRMYTAVEVDRNGCPSQPASEFYSDETIFVGVEESEIPAGTEMFMRLYYEGQPVEDTDPVQADRDMQTCVWFQFDPTGQAGFDPGQYEAELYVNGNNVDSVQFEITDAAASSGGSSGSLPNTGVGDLQLGQVYATTEVDQNGCPMDDVSEFYTGETVFISIDESYIPAGTEMFARLNQDGQAIEDTDLIVADQDLETCVWFEFQSGNANGLSAGEYEAEIYVNGNYADSVRFAVR